MDSYITQIDILTNELNSKLNTKKNFTLEEIDIFKQKISEGSSLINKIENSYFSMPVSSRKDYKSKMDNSKIKLNQTRRKVEKLEDEFNKKQNEKEEPLLVKHNVKFTQMKEDVNKEIDVAKDTSNNLDIGIDALRQQRDKIEMNRRKIENINESLSLHDQFMSVVNNRAMFNKVKLYFIVLMFFIGDLLMLYIKLR